MPCMKCGCSCNAPSSFSLQLDCSLPHPRPSCCHTGSLIPCYLHLLELWLLWLALGPPCAIALRPVDLTL